VLELYKDSFFDSNEQQMQTEFTLQQAMPNASSNELVRANPFQGNPNRCSAVRAASDKLAARLARLCYRHPLFIVGALWPLVLLAPHIPGVPRASIGGLPWRQELVLALLLTIALGLLCKQRKNELARISRSTLLVILPFVCFVFWTLLSAAWAGNAYAAIHLGMQWTTYLVFFFVLTAGLRNSGLMRTSLMTLAGVILMLAAACAIESWFGAPLTDGNLRSNLKPLLRGSGGFGEIMGMAAILFAALSLNATRRNRTLFFGATAIMAWLATLQSLERAPLVGAVAGFVLLFSGAAVANLAGNRPWGRMGSLVVALSFVFTLQLFPFSKRDTNEGVTSTIGRFSENLNADVSTRARYLFWGVGLEMARAHPLLGVGGGNYDAQYPTARAQFASRYPNSSLVALNEDLLTFYAHNEYVQLLAELGAFGFALFVLLSLSLVAAFWRALKRTTQVLPALGAAGAMLAFAVSSGASASSFRYFGGGLIFFFAAALLIHIGSAQPASSKEPQPRIHRAGRLGSHVTSGLCAVVLVVSCVFSAQATGTILQGLAEGSAEPKQAESFYQASLRVYPASPATHFGYGLWLYRNGRNAEAVIHLGYAAQRGFNSSICYAYLAGAARSAGDMAAAERALATSVSAYPRSVFLLVRYSSFLRTSGRDEEANALFSRAVSVDARAARGWRQLIDNDIDAAYIAAGQDKTIAMPGELMPQAAVFEVLQENEKRFPFAINTGWRGRMKSFQLR
jgi:O-antigen ligase